MRQFISRFSVFHHIRIKKPKTDEIRKVVGGFLVFYKHLWKTKKPPKLIKGGSYA